MLGIKNYIQLSYLRGKWRRRNKHNTTILENIFDIDCVSVGRGTYGYIRVLNHNEGSELKIGSFCSIAPEVTFILHSDHDLKMMSTFPFKVKYLGTAQYEAITKGNIIVKDDVWIGYGAIILSGVTIGQGAVIAAGAVVTKDVPPYAIVAGNPAQIKSLRFSNEIVLKLNSLDYEKVEYSFWAKYVDLIYQHVDDTNIDELMKLFCENY